MLSLQSQVFQATGPCLMSMQFQAAAVSATVRDCNVHNMGAPYMQRLTNNSARYSAQNDHMHHLYGRMVYRYACSAEQVKT